MNILGPPRKPLVKILKVEDLKNDDIVARIKKELASNLTFGKTDSIVSQKTAENKSEAFYFTPQVSKNTLNVISETIFIKHPQIKQEELVSEAPVEGTDADNEDADNEPQAEVVEQQVPAAEADDVIIDCDATITQEDISELGTDSRIIIVQDEGRGRGVYSRERREKFLKMTLADLPAKKEKIEKCYRYYDYCNLFLFVDA